MNRRDEAEFPILAKPHSLIHSLTFIYILYAAVIKYSRVHNPFHRSHLDSHSSSRSNPFNFISYSLAQSNSIRLECLPLTPACPLHLVWMITKIVAVVSEFRTPQMERNKRRRSIRNSKSRYASVLSPLHKFSSIELGILIISTGVAY